MDGVYTPIDFGHYMTKVGVTFSLVLTPCFTIVIAERSGCTSILVSF